MIAEVLLLAFGKSMGFLFLEYLGKKHLKLYLQDETFSTEVESRTYTALKIL